MMIFRILPLILLFSVSGCAPGLGKAVDVPNIVDLSDTAPGRRLPEGPVVHVLTFSDMRPSAEFVEIAGRRVPPGGNIPGNVRLAFEELLRQKAFQPSQFQGPQVTGEIVEWRATVSPGFPLSRVEAFAAVRMLIKDGDHNVVFHGTYSGSAQYAHPFLGNGDVRDTIGAAMKAALNATLDDGGFLEVLNGMQAGSVSQG